MKKWYASKTLWVNVIGMAALYAQSQFGFVVAPEIEAGALGIINLILRLVTKEPLNWKNEDSSGGVI